MSEVDFSYYKPINAKQEAFHKSKVMNKLLIGAYRSGKTYPAIHESIFICFDNPNHEFLVARNTWDSLRENVEKDFLRVVERSGAIVRMDKSKDDLYLKSGTVVRFRPLTMKIEQFKGMNLCGFYIDDPDVDRYKDVISFLFTRLTNPPGAKAKYFATIICANYEGHNWLWQKYIKGRKEGASDGLFTYWRTETKDNPTISEDYIKLLKEIHSKSWIDRYVNAKLDTYTGLVYEEYEEDVHLADLSWCKEDNELIKILAIDTGITHPTVVLDMATDRENIYIYNELYKINFRTGDLGEYLIGKDEIIKQIVIDPKTMARDQTSGISPVDILKKDYGIRRIELANNKVNYGIEIVKSLLRSKNGKTHIFIDREHCPNLINEIELYHWKTPEMANYDDIAFTEEPVKKDDDTMDAMRYGVVYLKKYLTKFIDKVKKVEDRRKELWKERYSKLKIYRKRVTRDNYELRRIKKIIKKSLTNKSHRVDL